MPFTQPSPENLLLLRTNMDVLVIGEAILVPGDWELGLAPEWRQQDRIDQRVLRS